MDFYRRGETEEAIQKIWGLGVFQTSGLPEYSPAFEIPVDFLIPFAKSVDGERVIGYMRIVPEWQCRRLALRGVSA